MQFLAVALVSVAAASDSTPSWLVWKPHDNRDAQTILDGYDAENVEAAAELEAKVEAAKHKPLGLNEAKKVVQKPLAHLVSKGLPLKAELDHYLSHDHKLGAHYSTQWATSPKKHVEFEHFKKAASQDDRYLQELRGEPVPPAGKTAGPPAHAAGEHLARTDAGASFSSAISSGMRDVVVQAQQMFVDKQANKAMNKLQAWSGLDAGSTPSQLSMMRIGYARGSQVSAQAQQVDLTGIKEAEGSNLYTRFLASRKDQVALDARDAERLASNAQGHMQGNGYMRSILSDADYLTSGN